jgi:hypothetical protein
VGIAHGSRMNVIGFHAEGVKFNSTFTGSTHFLGLVSGGALPPAIEFVPCGDLSGFTLKA